MAGSNACSAVPAPFHFLPRRRGKARVGARTARSKLLLLAGLLLAGAAGGLAAQFDRDLPAFVIIALIQGAVWAFAAALVLHGPDQRPVLALILGTAGPPRPVPLPGPVFFSHQLHPLISAPPVPTPRA